MTVRPIIISTLKTVPKDLVWGLKEQEIRRSSRDIPNYGITKESLETWGNLLTDPSERPSANTGVKGCKEW